MWNNATLLGDTAKCIWQFDPVVFSWGYPSWVVVWCCMLVWLWTLPSLSTWQAQGGHPAAEDAVSIAHPKSKPQVLTCGSAPDRNLQMCLIDSQRNSTSVGDGMQSGSQDYLIKRYKKDIKRYPKQFLGLRIWMRCLFGTFFFFLEETPLQDLTRSRTYRTMLANGLIVASHPQIWGLLAFRVEARG